MEFDALKQALIDAATAAGIAEYEIYYMETAEASATTFRHELKGVSSVRTGGICFRCIVGGKMGYASTELLEIEEMTELVSRAATAAAMLENEDEVFIWGGSPVYRSPEAAAAMAEMPALTSSALALAEQAYAADNRVADGTEATTFTDEITIRLCNSKGLDLSNRVSGSG
ncbi:MAG: hypothetical protein IJC15_07790, partial [Clostridia bacterium]|nr:hypothetical protein [Clostridia bacterium]